MLLVLLFGIAVRASFPRLVTWARPGIDLAARQLLRVGVALLGLRVALGDMSALGLEAVLLVIGSVVATLSGGVAIALLLRQKPDTAAIAATSVAICGASAALAAASVAPPRDGLERETTVIIVTVSLLSTVVMLLYPLLARLVGLDDDATSLLLGAAIHDVAQVAGAGFGMSPAIGVDAVTTKMIRIACLLPVVASLAALLAMQRGPARAGRPGLGATVPGFLLVFFALAGLAASGLVGAPLLDAGKQAAGWALSTAVAAIGLKTAFADLRTVPPTLLAALAAQTLWQLVVVLALIFLFFT